MTPKPRGSEGADAERNLQRDVQGGVEGGFQGGVQDEGARTLDIASGKLLAWLVENQKYTNIFANEQNIFQQYSYGSDMAHLFLHHRARVR